MCVNCVEIRLRRRWTTTPYAQVLFDGPSLGLCFMVRFPLRNQSGLSVIRLLDLLARQRAPENSVSNHLQFRSLGKNPPSETTPSDIGLRRDYRNRRNRVEFQCLVDLFSVHVINAYGWMGNMAPISVTHNGVEY